MPFLNRVRLPFQTTRPQYPEEREVFRLANGSSKTISSIIRKTYQLETGFLPDSIHEKFKVALAHDEVTIENLKMLSGVTQDGNYDIQWSDFQDFPIAKALTTVQVTPFNASKNNCQTCDELSQVVLVDDEFPSPLEEEEDYTLNVATNDTICCFPAVFSLVSFNSTYLASASINPDTGLLSVTTNADLVSGNNILLATYRVTCPNGGYDEAEVRAEVAGSQEGCFGPENLEMDTELAVSANVIWDDPTPAPDSYSWELFEATNLVTPVQTGTVAVGIEELPLGSLDPDTDYVLIMYGICDGDAQSEPAQIEFSTLPQTEDETCGQYILTMDDGTGLRGNYVDVTYINCSGENQNIRVFNTQSRTICAMQTSPGDPVGITASGTGLDYEYDGLC